MSRVIVAVSAPGDVRELIRAGHVLATLWDAETVAVHVTASAPAEMAADLRRQDAILEIHPGDPRSVIRDLAAQDDVAAVVLGSGTERGVSRFTESLVRELEAPVLVVPPGTVTALRRVLVPTAGDPEESDELERWRSMLRAQGIEVRPLQLRPRIPVRARGAAVPKDDAPLSARTASDLCRPEVADMVLLDSPLRTAGDEARAAGDGPGTAGDEDTGTAATASTVLASSRIPVLLLDGRHPTPNGGAASSVAGSARRRGSPGC